MTEPIAEKSGPEGWFHGTEVLPWSWALERLERERNYWVSTTLADGHPHSRPVFGIWLDDALWLSVAGHKMYWDLMDRPDVAVHVDSAAQVVILEGRAGHVNERADKERVVPAYNTKYGMNMQVTDEDGGTQGGLFVLRPRVAYGWDTERFVQTGTRWRF